MKHCEPIIWETWKPTRFQEYLCMICKEREATFFVDIISQPLTIRLSLCDFCASGCEEEIRAKILRKDVKP